MNTYFIESSLCTGCKSCFEICPRQAIVLVDDKAYIEPSLCDGCGLCASACAQDAILPLAVTIQQDEKQPLVKRKTTLAEKMKSPVASALLSGAATVLTRVVKNLLDGFIESGGKRGVASSRRNGTGLGRRQRTRRRGGNS